MKPRLPFVVSFFCVALFAGLVVASPDYSPLRDAVPFAPGAASSSIIPTPTDTHTLGASGSTWASLRLGAGTQLTAPTDGNLLIRNAAGTDASLLQFGGTTSAFPALKRNGVNIDARRADDSAYTAVNFSDLAGYSGATLTNWLLSGNGLLMRSTNVVGWSNGASAANTLDIGLARNAAGVLRVTNGSTGYGQVTARIVNSVSATPTEPYVCAAATAGGMVYVDDTDDTAPARMCFCGTTADDTTYDWLQVNDPTAACPSF